MSDFGLTLSVVVPVYNEEALVRSSIERLRAVPLRIEVICIDDASKDGSRAVLEQLHREGLVDVLLAHPRNQGKGAAVRAGIERATGDVIVIHDA
ncbi:MAG TPA: glycosyltransferase family 2 protein, partial [Longimicrobium sp.]|nr:glycosyltransferase family 2 protein [Longimicrobium sp.]